MKSTSLTIMILLGATLAAGCAKEVTDTIISDEAKTCTLNIVTRNGGNGTTDGDEGSTPTISEGRIYVMSGTRCVGMIALSEGATATTLTLPAGSYEVYAVGGNDLARFTLPTEEEATTTSTIDVKTNSVMDDLLTQTATVTLSDGETRQLNMTLERRVLRIDEVTVKQVPEEVTAVELMVEPTYSTMTLAGEYGTGTKAVKIALTEATEGTWQVTQAQQYAYPTKGKPTITVRFTTTSGVKSYSYEATEAWPANHKVSIVGTYTQPRGVSLSGTLTGTEWGEDITVSFDFDETNTTGTTDNNDEPTETPAVGTLYKGCYVVAAEGKNITVVSNTKKKGFATVDKKNDENIALLNQALANWPTENGLEGTWRIPTVDEARIYLSRPDITSVSTLTPYYCMDGTILKTIFVDSSNTTKNLTTDMGETRYLRPVMDITLP